MRFLLLAAALAVSAPAWGQTPLPLNIGGRVAPATAGAYDFGWPGVYFEGSFTGPSVEVAVDAGGEYSEAARVLLAAFLAGAHLDVRPVLGDAAALRANDPALVAGERELLGEAVTLVRSMENVTQD